MRRYKKIKISPQLSFSILPSEKFTQNCNLPDISMRAITRINTIARQFSASSKILAPKILYEESARTVTVTLNREKQLNSLDMDMIFSLQNSVINWNVEDKFCAILFKGKGKAFCAGGDVVELLKAQENRQPEDPRPAVFKTFFRQEYIVDYELASMKPYQIALWDGYVMGGGAGISIHSKYRIATENTVFAMPEGKIGFFTDVAGGKFLSELKNNIGLYLGLTSA